VRIELLGRSNVVVVTGRCQRRGAEPPVRGYLVDLRATALSDEEMA
jgi:hypothetical protein